jgi:hypothetical protein
MHLYLVKLKVKGKFYATILFLELQIRGTNGCHLLAKSIHIAVELTGAVSVSGLMICSAIGLSYMPISTKCIPSGHIFHSCCNESPVPSCYCSTSGERLVILIIVYPSTAFLKLISAITRTGTIASNLHYIFT